MRGPFSAGPLFSPCPGTECTHSGQARLLSCAVGTVAPPCMVGKVSEIRCGRTQDWAGPTNGGDPGPLLTFFSLVQSRRL